MHKGVCLFVILGEQHGALKHRIWGAKGIGRWSSGWGLGKGATRDWQMGLSGTVSWGYLGEVETALWDYSGLVDNKSQCKVLKGGWDPGEAGTQGGTRSKLAGSQRSPGKYSSHSSRCCWVYAVSMRVIFSFYLPLVLPAFSPSVLKNHASTSSATRFVFFPVKIHKVDWTNVVHVSHFHPDSVYLSR